jgi:protein SCO1
MTGAVAEQSCQKEHGAHFTNDALERLGPGPQTGEWGPEPIYSVGARGGAPRRQATTSTHLIHEMGSSNFHRSRRISWRKKCVWHMGGCASVILAFVSSCFSLRTWRASGGVLVLLVAASLLSGCRAAQAHKLSDDPLGGVALVNQKGTPVRADDYRGKVLVLSFFFTSCPVVCPRQTRELAEVWRALSPELRERVAFLSVSVDPENDTPEALARFAREHAPDVRGFTFARSSDEGTRALTTRRAVFDPSRPGGTRPDGHATAVYLFEPRGRLMQRYGGAADAPRLARDIQQIDSMSRSGN